MDMNHLPHYTGEQRPNCDYHHGQLSPVIGAGCFQVTRANRTHPEWDDGVGGTYKHGADLAFWKGKYLLHYFSNPMSEHTGAGQSILASSDDGMNWNEFQVVFPEYQIPACSIDHYKGGTHVFDGTSFAFIHQRVGFYRTKSDRMMLLGFYGFTPEPWRVPWDHQGIGRVIRELYPDGSLGPIYFIFPCWQAGWTRELLLYPLYTESPDDSFVVCCEELLADRLATQQWAEENGDQSDIIQIKHDGKSNQAFCWYHIDDETIIGLWKHARTARSDDNGKTWSPVTVSPTLVMSGQKVWAQKTDDGKFAMFYDPTMESTHRWPLCVTTSRDGLQFSDMHLVHGEVPPMRFGGFWKDFGPQYMRGIAEGIERPKDKVCVAYTVNKEDVWIAILPVPITGAETAQAFSADFSKGYDSFTVYSPKWAPITAENGVLRLRDFDRYDYAKAERVLFDAPKQTVTCTIFPHQDDHGELYIELQDQKGTPGLRLILRKGSELCVRQTAAVPFYSYQASEPITLKISADCPSHRFTISINGGEEKTHLFMTAVDSISRFVLRTGAPRLTPTREDDPSEDITDILPLADEKDNEAIYDILAFSVESSK